MDVHILLSSSVLQQVYVCVWLHFSDLPFEEGDMIFKQRIMLLKGLQVPPWMSSLGRRILAYTYCGRVLSRALMSAERSD